MPLDNIRRFSPLALLGLAACNEESVVSSISQGTALKGPLENARVYLDLDNSGDFSTGDTYTMTDADGKFSIDNPDNLTVFMETTDDTIDKSSGASVTGLKFSGSASDEVLTPFTTMKVENPDLDLDALATAMGLEGVDLTEFDPFGEDAGSENAVKYENISQQVASVLQVGGSALAAKGGNVNEDAATTAVFDVLADKLKAAMESGGEIDFTDATFIGEVVQSAGEAVELDEAELAELMATVASQISDINTQFAAVEELNSEVFQASTTLADLYDDNPDTAENVDAGEIAGNTAPEIALSNMQIAETSDDDAAPEGAIEVGDITITDNTEGSTVALSGADAAHFEIVNGKLYFKAGTRLDYEEKSSYELVITATDVAGASTSKSYTIELANVDEAGYYENATQTGAPIVGQEIVISADVWDPDNAINGNENNVFAQMQVEWFVDGVSVQVDTYTDVVASEETVSLAITEAMVGKEVTAEVSYTDQAGNEGFFDLVEFGTVIPDSALLNLSVYESDPEAAADLWASDMEAAGNGVEAMLDRISARQSEWEAASDAFSAAGNEDVIEVSSTGVKLIRGDYAIEATFTDFNPTTFEELEAAADAFRLEDPQTWTIDGGFSKIEFSGPDGSMFSLEYEADSWGSGDNIYDTMKIIDATAPDGATKVFGLNGAFDNQIGSFLNFAKSIDEAADHNDNLWTEDVIAGLEDLGVDYTYYPDMDYIQTYFWNPDLTHDENIAMFNQIDAVFEQADANRLSNDLSALDEWSQDYDIDGMFAQDSNYDILPSLQNPKILM